MSIPNRLLDSAHPSASLEQYRTLRTNLDFLRTTRQLKTIAITSGAPAAGKSLTTANLAMAFAMAGVDTLVLDTDLRRPAQHELFHLENRQGVTTALMRGQDPADFVQSGPLEHLYVLPSGPLPPYPTEVLANGRIEALLEEISPLFDVVLVDTAPVLPYAETSLVARAANGVLYVVRAAQSSRRVDRRALDHLARAQAEILGAVLNDASAKAIAVSYYG